MNFSDSDIDKYIKAETEKAGEDISSLSVEEQLLVARLKQLVEVNSKHDMHIKK